jgi:hypothetical protein
MNKPFCSIPGCARYVEARGLCTTHYMRQRRRGHTDDTRTPPGSTRAMVAMAAAFVGEECLEWTLKRYGNGYGAATREGHEGRTTTASRLVCIAAHGAPPFPRAEAAHSCGNKWCVNPGHLRWATHRENEADKIAHGTRLRGERSGTAKLTEAQVREIRALEGLATKSNIAARFGLHPEYVPLIWRRVRWGWMD